jgi:site-specific DNA-cytosine methylase
MFCGSGGSGLGFKQAGFTGCGIDYDPKACDDYQRLTGEPAHCRDLAAMTIPELLELVPECPDVVASSSPCLPADGIVMMENGPRRMDSVRPGERVLTHAGRFCRVDVVNVRPYQGTMHGLRLNGTIDADIQWYTDEHPIWVRRVVRGTDHIRTLRAPKWTPASKVKVNDRVGFPVPREIAGTAESFVAQFGNPQEITRKGIPYATTRIHDLRGEWKNPALWFLLGAYIGDGDRRNKGSHTVRYSVGARDGETCALVSKALVALGLRHSISADKGDANVRVQVSSRHLWQLCGLFGSTSHTKCIPETLMGLEDELLHALIDGLRATDGSNRAKYGNAEYGWSIGSVSLPLLRSVQRVMLRSGLYGGITRLARAGKMTIEGREVNISDSYTLAFINKPKKTCCKFEDGMVWLRVKKLYQRETSELVWNLEVDVDHTYCSPLIATHNCVGLSGCLSKRLSKTKKYQDFNGLALRGIQLAVETWKHSPTSKRKQPGLIVFENVPLIKSRGKDLLVKIVALLQAEGYSVNMSSHCCGEIAEDLAEKRPRFLLVARHMATVPDFLRKPKKHTPLAIKQVLCELPPPRPDTKGGHRLPELSDLNDLRLACIPAGGDWRDLPEKVYLYHCRSEELEAVTGIRWCETEGRQTGKLGVLAWEKAARTVIGNARVCQTWASVQDPRIGWATDGVYGDRPHAYGVADPDEPSATIRGKQLLVNSKASVVDPRLTCTPRATAYGMAADDQPSRTILGAQGHDNAVGSAVDPRLGHAPYKDSYGVEDMDRPGSVVRGEHTIRQAPAAAQDPRLSRRKAKPAKDHGIRYDERGWPIPTHELVRLDDGRLVLYGPPRDFTSKRPAYPRMVIRSYDGTWHRPLTTAELARIQGFPVGFEFCGSQAEQRKHVGNAVPPPTAKAIGLECMATLIASANGGFRLAGGLIWTQPEQEGMAA